jgi:hypothetical protein
MALNSPGTILKLWLKTSAKLDDGKKPAALPKKGTEQKTKIKISLTALKLEAPGAKANPAPFIKKRDKSALLLRKLCRYLKTAKDEDRKITQKYLKTVMGLAVVVASLDPGSLDLSEDEGSLEALDAQDTSALAAALEKPDNEAEADEEQAQEDAAPAAAATPEKAPATPANDRAARWKERDAKFAPHLKTFLQAGTGDIAGVTKLYNAATAAASQGDYDGALGTLDRLEPMVVKGAVTGMVGWQKAKIETINQIRKLQIALAKTRDPEGVHVVKLLEQVPQGLQIHPDSAENLQALETYITTDDTISRAEMPNPWGIQVAIREPLMKALAGLKK